MRNAHFSLSLIVLFVGFQNSWASGKASGRPLAASPQLMASLRSTPLQFEANLGQADPSAKFIGRGRGYTLFLTPTESVLVLRQSDPAVVRHPGTGVSPGVAAQPLPGKQSVVPMRLEGARQAPAIEGVDKLPGVVNYFIGNDPAKWRTDVPTYAKVRYAEAYPGIDLVYYGNSGKLEFDFVVAPGADPSQIRLAFDGAKDLQLAAGGDLLLRTEVGEVRLQKPVVYQVGNDGGKRYVAVKSPFEYLAVVLTCRHQLAG